MHLQLHIFRIQYSTERVCAAIGDISTMQCALHCKHGAKYSAHPPIYAIWTMVPAIYNAVTALHIQLNVSKMLLEISRQFKPRNTANMVPNTAHILQFTLCGLCSRPYTIQYQVRLVRLEYTADRIFPAMGHISKIQCALYWKLGANYSAHPPAFAMWTLVPDIYNAFTAPYIQTTIFIWTYLPC
jgi:hypothetical protein